MSSQYRIAEEEQQEKAVLSKQLSQRLDQFLEPLLEGLDAYLDKRLVRTFRLSLATIVRFRNQKLGLYLSKPGSYIL